MTGSEIRSRAQTGSVLIDAQLWFQCYDPEKAYSVVYRLRDDILWAIMKTIEVYEIVFGFLP